MDLSCFKAYDIRGRVPEELNTTVVDRVGRGMHHVFNAQKVVIGHDVRATSVELHTALKSALLECGVDVYDLGMCCTEETYFATFNGDFDFGLMVTASHNPIEFNGIKIVKKGAAPMVSADFEQLKAWIVEHEEQGPSVAVCRGCYFEMPENRTAFVRHLMGYVNLDALQDKHFKVVVNAGNGPAGLVLDALEAHLPMVEFIKKRHAPDPTFPNGIPNPVLVEQRQFTTDAVLENDADLGIAWDGDADRCCLFDAKGYYINPYYIVGLFAERLLKDNNGGTIVAEPRLNWATHAVAARCGGEVVHSLVGHGFIKQTMRKHDALFGGEASGHFYFKKFGFCDSGMIPWLMLLSIMAETNRTAEELVATRQVAFPCCDEINMNLGDHAQELIKKLEEAYAPQALSVDRLDGLSLSFDSWRFNLRRSNNEPWLVRLNVETRGDVALLETVKNKLMSQLSI